MNNEPSQKSFMLLGIVLLVLLLVDIYSHTQQRKEEDNLTTVVFAVRALPEGKPIGVNDIAETRVAKDRLPAGLVSKEQSYANAHKQPWYPSSKIDAFGRITCLNGISAGEILVYKYPGFTGQLLLEPTTAPKVDR